MDWHEFLTSRGAEATGILGILALCGAFWRWIKRMRAATRAKFAQSIGEQVGVAIAPVVERMDKRLSELDQRVRTIRRDFENRRRIDDERWERTERMHAETSEMYSALRAHMDREDQEGV